MKLITAIEIAENYPQNILITSSVSPENKKYNALCYRLKDGEIHKLMLSTDFVFIRPGDAEDYMKEIIESAISEIN